MITRFLKPKDPAEALFMLEAESGSIPLAGGTFLLTNEFRSTPITAVYVNGILPDEISVNGRNLLIGAGATMQDMIDSANTPGIFKKACLGMANRNIRNQATVAGNIATGKPCATLPPLFLIFDTSLRMQGKDVPVKFENWFSSPAGLITGISVVIDPKKKYGWGKWTRTACDLSILAMAASWLPDGKLMREVRIACDGVAKKPIRLTEMEKILEGNPLPSREEIEKIAAPLLSPLDDLRGSAAFKRMRASTLIADAILNAEVQ